MQEPRKDRPLAKVANLAETNPLGAFLLAQKTRDWLVTVGDDGENVIHTRIFVPYKREGIHDAELLPREQTVSAVQRFANSCQLDMQVREGVPMGGVPNLYCEIFVSKADLARWSEQLHSAGERRGYLQLVHEIEKFRLGYEISRVLPRTSQVPLDGSEQAVLCVSGIYKETNPTYIINDERLPEELTREIKPPFEFTASRAEIISRRNVIDAIAGFEAWANDFEAPLPTPEMIEQMLAEERPHLSEPGTPKWKVVTDGMGLKAQRDVGDFQAEYGDNLAFSILDFEKFRKMAQNSAVSRLQAQGSDGNLLG